VHFPEATWKFLVHAAANVAPRFLQAAPRGQVMAMLITELRGFADGPLNDRLRQLRDQNETRRYHCEVGVATHLAPGIAGEKSARRRREFRHDNFGLAVIFSTAFLGRHPSPETMRAAKTNRSKTCIRELRFAYGSNADSRGIKQPPGTLSLRRFAARRAAFERAFLTEDRPGRANGSKRSKIVAQSDSMRAASRHHFCGELQICPWCEIETQTGLMLFPFTSGGTTGESFNIFTVESLVASFGAPQNLR
jgi:DNA-binding helix-hairpin-helix protein with protein kinase domain